MISEKLDREIREFCALNNITDTDAFVTECFIVGFNIKKYGDKPKLTPIKVAIPADARMIAPEVVPTQPIANPVLIVKEKPKDDYDIYDS